MSKLSDVPFVVLVEDEIFVQRHKAQINYYANLLTCYRSGQISEKQWQEHLQDKEFAEYVRREAN